MRWLLLAILVMTAGCNNLSPFNPQLRNEIDNQNGQIEDIRNNQNGFMLELGQLRNQTEINARDIGNLQQGLINNSNQNSGVQVLQGEGALILVFGTLTIAMLLIFHYRSLSLKNEKIASMLCEQIALNDDIHLDNDILMAAMNTDVEQDVYRLMVKSQQATGTSPQTGVRSMSLRPKVSRNEFQGWS